MVRFPIDPPAALPASRRAAYDRIVAERGKLPLPYRAVLASPDVAEQVERLSQRLWKGELPPLVLEAVFLSVARVQQCRYQWDNHVPKALEAGLTQESLDLMRDGRIPAQSDMLAAALRFVDEMQAMKLVQDRTFADVLSHFGDKGMAELLAFLGLATSISFLLNAQQRKTDSTACSGS
jgi:alkylhydroperoxidase family enzyme